MSDKKIIVIPEECGSKCRFYDDEYTMCSLFDVDVGYINYQCIIKCPECATKTKVEIVYGE